MWKEALLGCSAICGIGALAAFPNHAIAQSATIVRTGSVYPEMASATAAAIKGDTINVAPGTLWIQGPLHTGVHANDFFVETDIVYNCTGSVGAGPGPSRGCVLSGDFENAYAAPNPHQTIGKGLMVIAQGSGEYPNVTIDGFAFMYAEAGVCGKTLCTDANFLSGRTAVANQLWQFQGGNAAGVRYQAGNLTVKNSYFAFDNDGLFVDPFIQSTGTVSVSNSQFEFDGATGQEHNMYISRVYKFTIDGSTSQESYQGQDLKCRAVICQVGLTTGNTFGSHSTLDASGNQLQFPDGGQVDVRNNLIIKGPNRTNPYPIEYGGVVIPWATQTAPSHFNFSGNTVLTDAKGTGPAASPGNAPVYVINITPNVGSHNLGGGTYDVQITGNTLAGAVPAPAVLGGLGNQTGNINNLGSTWPATLNTTVQAVDFGPTFQWDTIFDETTIAGPVNLTLPQSSLNFLVLGGSGALTVNTTSCAGCAVVFGAGGGTIWQNPTATTGVPTAFFFNDAIDGSSGPVSAFFGVPLNGMIFGDNGTFSSSSQKDLTGAQMQVGGRNVVYNECPFTAPANIECGTVEVKHGIGTIVPSVTLVGRNASEHVIQIQSGAVSYTGTVSGLNLWGNSDTLTSNGPAVAVLNRTLVPTGTETWVPFVLSGSVSGNGFSITGPNGQGNFTHGGMVSFADTGHHNIWYPGAGPWEIDLARDTVMFGASTALAVGPNNPELCAFYPGIQEAFVPGSGNASANLACIPAIIEIINGQGNGTLNISAYKTNPYPVTFLGFPTTPANTPTVVGTGETVVINGGPTLAFTSFTGAMNTTAPAGSGSIALAMGATQTTAANTTVALTGMVATDTFAAGYAGVLDLQLKPVNGKIVSMGTTIGAGTTGTILNDFVTVNSFLAAASFVALGVNGSVTGTLWDQAGAKATGSKSIIVSGVSSNDMMLSLVNGPFTILPGNSVVVDVDLEDQFASGTAGTLSATVSLQTNGAVVFHGTTHASSGSNLTFFTVGESFIAMQTDLANMTYIGTNPGQNDVISASVTNQGAFSQTVTAAIASLVQADMQLTVPATSTIAANTQDNVGLSVNINDAYAQTIIPQTGFIFTANTDSGTLYLNGVPQPKGVVLNDTFVNVNALIDEISYLGTQASTGTITWTATNQGGFSQSGSTVETVLPQGTTNDTTIAFPKQITISSGGSIALQGISINDLFAQTAGGPVTLAVSDTTGSVVFNGVTTPPGQTALAIDTLPNINADVASLGYIAAGTTNCDGIVLKFTNQGPFTTTNTISATVTAAPFSLTGPSSETIATNGTVAVPITLTDGSGVVGNDRAVITTTTGTIVISGQVHAPPVNVTLSGPAANLRTFLAGMQYIAAAGPGSDSIVVSATNVAGAQTSQVTIPVNVTTGVTPPGACPLPP